jgi:hypothetical protein
MHDIDRVRLETQSEAGPFELGEIPQFEFAETGEVFGETENMELASALLEVSSEQELEQFIGDLVGKAGRALGQVVDLPAGKSFLQVVNQLVGLPAGKSLRRALKDAARHVLPSIGSSLGRYFGDDTGAKLGGQVAHAAGRVFGLELEGLSGEDREFEVARRYVDFAAEAVRNLAENLAENAAAGDPRSAAKAAATAAAQTHAPGLLQLLTASRSSPSGPAPHGAGGASGRWVRHGSRIVLYGT